MAYSSSRGGSARPPARGGGFGPAGRRSGGGGSNMTAYAIAAVILVLVVVLVMALKKKPTPPKEQPIPQPAPVAKAPDKPKPASTEKPFKPLSDSFLTKGRELAKTFEKDADEGNRLYAESLKLKDKDQVAWQKKLTEAVTKLDGINRRWNDFLDSLPSDPNYSSEDIARHFFSRESGKVAQWTKQLAAVKTDQR